MSKGLEQRKEFLRMVEEESLSADKTEKLMENCLFAQHKPLRDEVIELIAGENPRLLQRKKMGYRILSRIKDFVDNL